MPEKTNACKTCEPLLAEALFGELGEEDRLCLEAHVAGCPACAAELRSLQGVLDVAREPARPVRSEAYWDGYYDRLAVRMAAEAPARRPGLWAAGAGWVASASERLRALLAPAPPWTLQAGLAVVLVIVGILLGRYVLAPEAAREVAVPEETVAETEVPEAPPADVPPDEPAPGAEEEEAAPPERRAAAPEPDVVLRPVPSAGQGHVQAAAVTEAGRYLERSKVLLLGLVNYDEEDVATLDLDRKRRVARELIDEARPLREALSAADRQQLGALVADLEVILLQIANIEARLDAPAIELIKSGVDRKALLLKINIEEMRMADDAAPAAPGAVPTPKI